jgi:hypothetical protein
VQNGEIQWDENSPPADAGDWWTIPLVIADPGQSGWDTCAITVNTRNRSEWQGTNATFKYQGWTEAGAELQPWTDTATGSHELFPARMQNVSQIPPSGYSTLVGRLRVETNTSCSHGLAVLSGTDWIFVSEGEIARFGGLTIAYDVVDEPAEGTQYASGFGPNNCNVSDFVFMLNGEHILPCSVETIEDGFRFNFLLPIDALKGENLFAIMGVLDWAGNAADPLFDSFRIEDILPEE